jgi:NAD-dependent deacetylase sirtuin 5
VDRDNRADPVCPALAAASEDVTDPSMTLPLLDPAVKLARIERDKLPACPRCGDLQRPGVVWFGEQLDSVMLREIDDWIDAAPIDLVLTIGTSAVVYPAAGYIQSARSDDTIVATVNLDAELPNNLASIDDKDFAFAGDASQLLPRLLEPIIGEMQADGSLVESK